jgi:hypothetical protein
LKGKKDSNNEILRNKANSILLIEEREKKDIIIGAPHHALGGIKYLPCADHEDADENTGFIARQIAKALNISSLVACNYRIDPNKSLRTDYSMQIAEWKPKYLIEIHGHGAKSISKHLIEISSGNLNRNSFSQKFSKILETKLTGHKKLKHFRVLGDFNHLYFKGTKSATITDDRWIPFHIELPPLLRLTSNNKLPKHSTYFTNFLIETIEEVCI